MCIILPVDHLPCTHTVAIWQHCINAPRSKIHGLAPCSHIRQHPRPILTRKLCFHCGGPRFFARRGGIAERGKGSGSAGLRKKVSLGDPEDSGYHSDSIIGEDEVEDDWNGNENNEDEQENENCSPCHKRPHRSFSQTIHARRENEKERNETRRKPEAIPTRKPSWRPNLKAELAKMQPRPSPFPRRESNDSQFEDGIGRARRSNWPSLYSSTESPLAPNPLRCRRNADSFPVLQTSIINTSSHNPLQDLSPSSIYSSHFASDSDVESDSEHGENELNDGYGNPASFLQHESTDVFHDDNEPSTSVILAQSAKMARASRIEFHGAQVRVLRI
ncbi:uncharacterized protein BDR25DRAFT_342587 [Lindgomyces ingoldianus]|uniref:Uncharacterized protein n=1 Tax=Lindgomyces ingoldianus TaxID=673940 RepID=A0ACB6QYE9_9PLEO|nr:uncharacterized protein BDR25DRAFT_342587 [Lindgomyces ingoldianus]KAF2471297.1 hypothetical protein BDR25DRAFT_342587 [Lindgomyces ingoldianus]